MASSLDADWGEHRETALTRPVSRVGLGNVASLGNATRSGASRRPTGKPLFGGTPNTTRETRMLPGKLLA